MNSNQRIEAAAKALARDARAYENHLLVEWDALSSWEKEKYRRLARVALLAADAAEVRR